jgi:hypothetical protein
MQEDIVDQTRWVRHMLLDLRIPSAGRLNVDHLLGGLDLANNRQARERCSGERHTTSGIRKVPDDEEDDLVLARPEPRRNVDGVIVPNCRAAPRWPHGYSPTINEELVPCVGSAMHYHGAGWR